MSVDAIAWAFRLDLPPTDKLILLALADRADESGRCFPSNCDITWRTHLHERTLRRTVARLAELGILRIEPRFGSDGRQRSNIFQLLVGGTGAVGFTPHPRSRVSAAPYEPHLDDDEDLDGVGHPARTPSPPPPPAPDPRCPPPGLPSPPLNRHYKPQEESASRTDSTEFVPAREAFTRQENEPKGGQPEPRGTDAPRVPRRETVHARVPFPADWTASELDRAYATKLLLDPDAMAAAFRRYWLRRLVEDPGSAVSTNWSRNWQTWCRNEVDFAKRDAAAAAAAVADEPQVAATAISSPVPGNPQFRQPGLSTLDPDLTAMVRECLDDPGSRTLWRWALAQQGIEVMWRDNHGRQTCSFSLGKGYLDVIIINLCYHGGIPKITPADCNQVVAWMADYPVVGEFIDTATETILESRERWKGAPPYSLRAYDPAMQRAAVTWRDSRMGQAYMRDAAGLVR